MRNRHSILTLLFISVLLGSCTDKKETESFNLEQQLLKADYSKLQMEKMPSGHLHIVGELNGIKGNFILDTGAGATVIEEKNREKFNMSAEESEEEATGAGGTNIQMQASDDNNFTFDTFKINDFNLLLMNLDHVNDAFESMGLEKIDGVIGADILTNHNAIIDYSNLILFLKE